jgi:hypothetical protein
VKARRNEVQDQAIAPVGMADPTAKRGQEIRMEPRRTSEESASRTQPFASSPDP